MLCLTPRCSSSSTNFAKSSGGEHIANIVMLRISGMLQPDEKGFKIDFASLAVGILQKHDQNLSGVCLEV